MYFINNTKHLFFINTIKQQKNYKKKLTTIKKCNKILKVKESQTFLKGEFYGNNK